MKSGWQIKKLGDVYQIGSSKRVLKSQWKTEGVPFYRGREVTRLAADGFVENELFISEEHFAELSKQYGVPKSGDIVVTAIGTIGNSHIVKASDRFYFKDASILWMKRISDVSSEFINYWLKSPLFYDQLDKGNGATVDTLTIKKLQSVELLMPPLPEQQRIVAVLDKAFAGIATATENAKKNLENARELFESNLQSIFTTKGDGWVEKTLGDVYDVRDGTHDSPKYQDKGYPLITSKNLGRDGLHFDKVKYISETDFKKINERSAVHKGDILFAMIGTIGNPIVVEIEPNFAIKNVALFKVSPAQSSRFLKYYLESEFVQQKMASEAKGTTQRFVGLGYLRGFPISFPPLPEQQRIVAQLDTLSAETKRLEAIYQQKLDNLGCLKQSILQKAFAGELHLDKLAA